jgi:hypothetical protein
MIKKDVSQEESDVTSETLSRSELRFPQNPTVLEIFKIRMLEEPLAPIGADPT